MDHWFTRMRARAAIALVAVAGLAAANSALAQDALAPAYSANAMQRYADGSTSQGRVVKSGLNMRLEYDVGDSHVIQIIRGGDGVMLMLDPARKAYVVARNPQEAAISANGYQPPCPENDPALDCTFTGTEVISGITAEVWQIARRDQPGATSTILWDGARHKALAQTGPDGSSTRLTFVAMVEVAGRQAEHWRVEVTTPGQAAQDGGWYYDPELRVAIREEFAGGEARWLEDIDLGAVPPEMFEPPSDWTRMEMPAPGAGPGTGPGAGLGAGLGTAGAPPAAN